MASKSSLYPHKSTPLSKSASASNGNSSSLAFATSLSSLLATSASTPSTQSRPRPSKGLPNQSRDSIFTTHVRNTKKRAAPESSRDDPTAQKHARTSESVDAATLHRSKRRMEEKARLYASMKRGDYVPPTDGRGRDKEAEGLVDFDRKWAESTEGNGSGGGDNTSSDEYYEDSEPEDLAGPAGQATVEYEDEFGRMRTGTARDAAREQARQRAAAHATASLAEASARPSRPDNLIYGDTVQAAAFNPDATLTAQMAGLAQKRDRSATPPEEVHYDASKEVRAKGVGFFQFSKDKEGREREMERLGREREETERGRRERDERKEERKRKIEERRRLVAQKRGEKLAERFLDELDVP